MLLAKIFQCFLLVTALLLIGRARAAEAPPAAGVTPIGLDATPEQMSAAVSDVRAGRKLAPKHWPGGARVAVALTFDIDNETWSGEQPRCPCPCRRASMGL